MLIVVYDFVTIEIQKVLTRCLSLWSYLLFKLHTEYVGIQRLVIQPEQHNICYCLVVHLMCVWRLKQISYFMDYALVFK